MNEDGTVESWNERSDFCFGQMMNVLAEATQRWMNHELDSDEAHAGAIIAETWHAAGIAWAERYEYNTEPDDELAESEL